MQKKKETHLLYLELTIAIERDKIAEMVEPIQLTLYQVKKDLQIIKIKMYKSTEQAHKIGK